MSADNWTKCPQCMAKDAEKSEALWTAMGQSYGKVTPERYLEMRDEAKQFDAAPKELTLREDYDVGIEEDGAFRLDFRSSCNVCDFVFRHKVEIDRDGIAAWAEANRPTPVVTATKRLGRRTR